ncbi:MAG TPA: hypothetical protein VG755_19510 [Nannocystaceae bacterium]|nr:hypothetical protein [Nannocystaceae bacterium]
MWGWVALAWWALVAPSGELALAWEAPAECPQIEVVRERVRAAWGDREVPPIAARARIVAEEKQWRLVLQLSDASGAAVGERVLVGASCDVVTDAGVLALVVAATSSVQAEADAAPPPVVAPAVEIVEPPPTSAAPLEPVAPIAAPPPAPAEPPPRVYGELAIAGGLDARAMPGIGGTLFASIGLRRRALVVQGFVLHGIQRRVTSEGVEARHRLTAGGIATCGLGRVGPIDLGGCGKVELGQLRSNGTRGLALSSSRGLWAAVSFGALVRWSFIERVGLSLAVDGVVPLLQQRFVVGDADVGRSGPIGVRVLAGLVVRFG